MSINKVILVGHLGGDPEIRYTPTGTPYARFSLATQRKWKDEAQQLHEEVDWHSIVAWAKLAEVCGQFLTKGSKVYVEGALRTRTYDDQDKTTHRITEVVVQRLEIMSRTKEEVPEEHEAPPAEEDVPF